MREERPDAYAHYRIVITPIAMSCWLVWDDGEMSGSHFVAAVGQQVHDLSLALDAEPTHRYNRKTERLDIPGVEFRSALGSESGRREFDDNEIDGARDESFDWPKVYFLVLAQDCGEWESPWVEQKYVFFSEPSAMQAAERRAARAAKEAVP